MAGAKEIRTQIGSVKNTRKVTRALEMVSASKIRKAQDRMQSGRPYSAMIRRVVGHIAQANPDYKHPFMVEREKKRVGMIVIGTDRGLCGGLNTNLFKKALAEISAWQSKGVEIELVTIGSKAEAFFKRITGVKPVASVTGMGEDPRLEELIGLMKILFDGYREERLDGVYLLYNDFINTMSQRPTADTLLPLPPAEVDDLPNNWDYIYEPEPESVLDEIMVRYVESVVYQAVVENLASEHAARMIAMKNASDNANKMIDELQLVYNKARQAAITQEISEIVSGAAAV
jgi:F-type H+-transporting ATPase subunit gamma